VHIRALRADDDMDAQVDLAEQAFGALSADARGVWLQRLEHVITSGTAFGAFDGGRVVGGAVFFDMRQWWCGRAVPMAGVGNVQVAPEDRGRGVGRALMTTVLDEIAARGFPLSVLSPATMPIYRSLGWELAGGRYAVSVPSRSLRDLIPPDVPVAPARPAIRRIGPADAGAAIRAVSRIHEAARHCGPVTWDAMGTAINLARPGFYSYLCDDGFLAYRWHNGNNEMFVERVQAASPDALRGLLSIVASHSSMASSVQGWVNPVDPLWWLTRERDATIVSRRMWMLRVVDAPAAIAARGFPPAVSMRTALSVVDQSCPANAGTWMLDVANGKGELAALTTPAGIGATPLTLSPRGMAALYAGTPVISLRLAGLVAGGDPDNDAALDSAFCATPYMLDTF
jgi:predicted acetyltransferase